MDEPVRVVAGWRHAPTNLKERSSWERWAMMFWQISVVHSCMLSLLNSLSDSVAVISCGSRLAISATRRGCAGASDTHRVRDLADPVLDIFKRNDACDAAAAASFSHRAACLQ